MKNTIKVDSSWTLFLDRDGVINQKLEGDYVKKLSEFQFIPGALESIAQFNKIFQRILVVTNQQGIGKGLMSHEDLSNVHDYMFSKINASGGRIDKVYYCPELQQNNSNCRKPNTGMPKKAQLDFPEIDFAKCIMVGDSHSDIEMGKRLKMTTVFLSEHGRQSDPKSDFVFSSLEEFKKSLVA